MLKDVLKSVRRKAAFGVENIKTAPGRWMDERNLNDASKRSTSAVNKTGQAFALRELGPGWQRGYDNMVKRKQQSELKQAGKTMQNVSENNRKRLERLNNIQ